MSLQSYEDISSIQLLLHNLDLLEFDPQHDIPTSHVYHTIVFDTDLFTHHRHNVDDTNQRAFECISYFLFRRMDVAQTNIKFASCWPIHEHSTTSHDYRMTAYQWLLELQDQRLLSRHLTLHRSYFDTCHGEAFINIIMCFSVLVLQTVMDRDLVDPRGRPIRLTPSYNNNNSSSSSTSNTSSSQVKRAPPTILTGDTEAIEKQLAGAIRSLAHYTNQQKDDFAVLVKRARDKTIALEQQWDRNSSISTLDQQHTTPDLPSIRERIATLRSNQRRTLEKLQLKQQNDGLSQSKRNSLEELALKNLDEFEEMQALLLNDDILPDMDRSTQDHQHSFILPSLIPSHDSDPAGAIQRIQDLIQLHIQRD